MSQEHFGAFVTFLFLSGIVHAADAPVRALDYTCEIIDTRPRASAKSLRQMTLGKIEITSAEGLEQLADALGQAPERRTLLGLDESEETPEIELLDPRTNAPYCGSEAKEPVKGKKFRLWMKTKFPGKVVLEECTFSTQTHDG